MTLTDIFSPPQGGGYFPIYRPLGDTETKDEGSLPVHHESRRADSVAAPRDLGEARVVALGHGLEPVPPVMCGR
jgi:hypothetical protein